MNRGRTQNGQCISLPNESCPVSRNSLCYRSAKLINCLLETGLVTVDFSKKKPSVTP